MLVSWEAASLGEHTCSKLLFYFSSALTNCSGLHGSSLVNLSKSLFGNKNCEEFCVFHFVFSTSPSSSHWSCRIAEMSLVSVTLKTVYPQLHNHFSAVLSFPHPQLQFVLLVTYCPCSHLSSWVSILIADFILLIKRDTF